MVGLLFISSRILFVWSRVVFCIQQSGICTQSRVVCVGYVTEQNGICRKYFVYKTTQYFVERVDTVIQSTAALCV